MVNADKTPSTGAKTGPVEGSMKKTAALVLCVMLVVSSVGSAVASSSSYMSTTYYKIYYGSYSSVATALANSVYLNAAYTAASGVIGYSTSNKINIYFYSSPSSSTLGYTYAGQETIYINLYKGSSTSSSVLAAYGSTIAHETGHVLFFDYTKLQNSYTYNVTWLTEALSYYIGDVAYAYGSKYSKSTISSYLNYYSSSGKTKQSWYTTGKNYYNGSVGGMEWYQLHAIGYFLENYGSGSTSVKNLLTYLHNGTDFETAFSKAYGLSTGDTSTTTSSSTNTLYSKYYYYWYGKY